jgi:hypothetical protein
VGAVVCLGLLVAGCSNAVSLDSPALSGTHAAACRHLTRGLPGSVDDQTRRTVTPSGAHGAAWGDPAIVLTCGVPRPHGLTRAATCQVTNGVGWYIPLHQMTGQPRDITMTTVGRAEYVEVQIPADYWPPAPTMADLAPAIKRAIREVRPCV